MKISPSAPLLVLAALSLTLAPLAPAGDKGPDSLDNIPPASLRIPPAPHLSVPQSLASLKVEKGFRVSPIVAEPDVVKPVQIAFDEDGRLWVVEMRGYMPDLKGTGEDIPQGRVSVHEDRDGDGIYETHSVFLDNLLLPRAIAFGDGGVLISEHQKLLWVPRDGAKIAGTPQVVDEKYAAGGNVEHRASGLLLGPDNAYYSTYTNKAYRQAKTPQGGQWGTLPSEARGQFGIGQDDYGRLVSNNNSLPASLDQMPPYFLTWNEAARFPTPSVKTDLAVYPIRVTPGTNRAYIRSGSGQDVDKDWKLSRATATCSPLWYTGGLPEFGQSLFVPEPAGNLMMGYAVAQGKDSFKVTHPTHAFLASTDERFRPVNTAVGPDGCVYVVDFDSGIIQHKVYVTNYLAKQIKSRNLEDEKPAGYGRIWRIAPEGLKAAPKRPHMSAESGAELVAHLADPNKWWRDTAQRLLIARHDGATLPLLMDMAAKNPQPLARFHALWTLQDMGELKLGPLADAWDPAHEQLCVACCRLLAEFKDGPDASAAAATLETWAKTPAPSRNLKSALAWAAGAFQAQAPAAFRQAVAWSADAQVSRYLAAGSAGREAAAVAALPANAPKELAKALASAAAARKTLKNPLAPGAVRPLALKPWDPKTTEVFKPGEKAFSEICGACHGPQGDGISGIAPPFVNSEWVEGSRTQLITAVLNGVTGPVSVDGKHYKLPGTMPGFLDNPSMDDEQLAAILTYIRTQWGNTGTPITADQVKAVRAKQAPTPIPMTQAQVRAVPLEEDETPTVEIAVAEEPFPIGGKVAVGGMSLLFLLALAGAGIFKKLDM